VSNNEFGVYLAKKEKTMPTYKVEKPTGNERYNVVIPKVRKFIPVDISGMPSEMAERFPKQREIDLGSIELKNINRDVARAIMLLCEADNIPVTLELIEETPNIA
jgi:hypothetical protein